MDSSDKQVLLVESTKAMTNIDGQLPVVSERARIKVVFYGNPQYI